jgi:hypothetical protein
MSGFDDENWGVEEYKQPRLYPSLNGQSMDQALSPVSMRGLIDLLTVAETTDSLRTLKSVYTEVILGKERAEKILIDRQALSIIRKFEKALILYAQEVLGNNFNIVDKVKEAYFQSYNYQYIAKPLRERPGFGASLRTLRSDFRYSSDIFCYLYFLVKNYEKWEEMIEEEYKNLNPENKDENEEKEEPDKNGEWWAWA